MLEPLRHPDDVLLLIDEILRQISVPQINTSLIIDLLAGHVVGANQVVDRPTGPADSSGDVVSWSHAANVRADLDHLSKRLVPQH